MEVSTPETWGWKGYYLLLEAMTLASNFALSLHKKKHLKTFKIMENWVL